MLKYVLKDTMYDTGINVREQMQITMENVTYFPIKIPSKSRA